MFHDCVLRVEDRTHAPRRRVGYDNKLVADTVVRVQGECAHDQALKRVTSAQADVVVQDYCGVTFLFN